MTRPYMVIEVRISGTDLLDMMAETHETVTAAYVRLLASRGLRLRSTQDFDGTITHWEDPATHRHHFRQTILESAETSSRRHDDMEEDG